MAVVGDIDAVMPIGALRISAPSDWCGVLTWDVSATVALCNR